MIGGKRHCSYLGVAATCLITHNVIMIGTDAAGLPLALSVLASFSTVALLGYFLHSRFTFGEGLSWAGLSRYGLAMSLNIPISFVIVWIWKSVLAIPMWIASPAATICTLTINYAISRKAIVTPRKVAE